MKVVHDTIIRGIVPTTAQLTSKETSCPNGTHLGTSRHTAIKVNSSGRTRDEHSPRLLPKT